MSFSQQVKQEITAKELPRGCCAISAAYGIACFGRYFDVRGIVLQTEQEAVAKYAQKVLGRAGITGAIIEKQRENGHSYEFSVKNEGQVRNMLAQLGHTGRETALRISNHNFHCEHCVCVFAAAAFLCCGTMTNPEMEYNLEFSSPRYNLMKDFEALLMGRGFHPKHTVRKGSNVLYLKASEQIEDLLTLMGASGAALEIMNMKVYKDFRNKANRIANCETANIEKTVMANVAALSAIAYLEERGAMEQLPPALQEAAALRKAMPEACLKELAAQFSPPMSKAGLSHRFKKLEKIAAEMKERATNG